MYFGNSKVKAFYSKPVSIYHPHKVFHNCNFSSKMSTTIFDIKRPIESQRDPSTLSNYYAFNVNLTDIEYHVDWEKKILVGKVIYDLSIKESSQPSSIILDTSYLNVFKASINDEETPFVLDENDWSHWGLNFLYPCINGELKLLVLKLNLSFP